MLVEITENIYRKHHDCSKSSSDLLLALFLTKEVFKQLSGSNEENLLSFRTYLQNKKVATQVFMFFI